MEIFGIGLPELALILVVVFLVLGPKDMASTARRLARTIRMLTQSDFWRATRQAWKMAQDIPGELLRETGLEEARQDLVQLQTEINKSPAGMMEPHSVESSSASIAVAAPSPVTEITTPVAPVVDLSNELTHD